MILLRKILFPFSVLYGIITSFRNFLFDIGMLKSHSFLVPIIAVGNLNVGGTGKTPQIEYLIRLLSPKYKVATLSRGYKRKTKGFVLADATSNALTLGDEPLQFYSKFKSIQVAVDANRKNGIEQLLSQKMKPDVILLDDAFQHRKVKAGFYILLTSYGDLYSDDWIVPTGNLRESRRGAHRADLIIVTKCPRNLPLEDQNRIKTKLKLVENQDLFFSFISYDDCIYSETETLRLDDIDTFDKLLIAGIAKPISFFEYLKNENDVCLTFPDHHQFTNNDLEIIKNKSKEKLIVTTEKDYVRLKNTDLRNKLFYLPIKSCFVNESTNFDKKIIDYVGSSAGNR